MPHDLASWSVCIGIEAELTDEFPDDLLMLLGLLQVLFPFFFEILVRTRKECQLGGCVLRGRFGVTAQRSAVL
jgi:hypothetical protein